MKIKHSSLILLSVMSSSVLAFAEAPLKADPALDLPGNSAHFDFMEVDAAHERLLAAHKGTGTLVLLDLKNEKILPAISVGHAQGVAVDERSGVYVIGDQDEHKVVFVDATSLKISGEVAVNGPVDAVTVDAKNGMIYADEDDGSHVWVIDPTHQKLIATVEIPGVPEFIAYDFKTDRVYQNIKDKDLVAVINPSTNKVESQWSTAPASGPHGLAIDSASGHLFVAGHGGKLVMIDVKSGKVVSQTEIAPGTDQIAFNPKTHTIYCASKGFISVVKVTGTKLESIGNVPDHKGSHTLAVDSKSDIVWTSYSDDQHSYLQRFTK